jgi:hypothetical protein
MSVHPSSKTFGDAMGQGWKEALEYKFDKKKLEVRLNYLVKDQNDNDIGDIDFMLTTDYELSVYEDLFPMTKLSIRPPRGTAAAAHKSDCFLAEIKRSMNVGDDKKIDQFVRFYSGIFGGEYEFQKANNSTVKSTKSLFARPLNKVVANPRTQLLFVFNGMDLAHVQTVMRRKIESYLGNNEMKIHGHPVICVWCDSAELIKWKEGMLSKEKDEIIVQKDEIIVQKDEVIKQLKEELKRKHAGQKEHGKKKRKS